MPKRARRGDKNIEGDEKPHPGLTLGNFVPVQYSHELVGSTNGNTSVQGNDTVKSREGEGATLQMSASSVGVSTHQKQHEENGYKIMRTKKGGLPVSTESRSSGKKVTIIHGVTGDAKSLVQHLKSSLGTGGLVTSDGNIELQGDLLHRVERYLKEHREILIPYKKKE